MRRPPNVNDVCERIAANAPILMRCLSRLRRYPNVRVASAEHSRRTVARPRVSLSEIADVKVLLATPTGSPLRARLALRMQDALKPSVRGAIR